MPALDKEVYDGHSTVLGVDSNTDPGQLSPAFLSGAINRSFRGSENRTRPPFQTKNLVFDDPEDEEVFRHGNISSVIGYRRIFAHTQPHVVVAVADRILKGRIFGDTISFSLLHKGINPLNTLGWFCQAEDRLYFQNGETDPIGWNGSGKAYIIEGGLAEDKMPIGNIMAYVQGRLVVFTDDNSAIVSDYIYGNGLTNTRGVESFIEAQGTNDLGAIRAPALMGEVVGAIAVPRTPNRNGQGDLLVMTAAGAYTMNLTGLRESWLYGDIQQIVLTGRGGASPFSLTPLNNDIWFRCSDGAISSYKFERSELDRSWGDTSLSREVAQYLRFDVPQLLRYSSSMSANNRLLSSCAIQVRANDIDGYGNHRFGMGILSLDFDTGSTVNKKPGFAWDGMWTGMNPVQLFTVPVDNEHRALCASHDEDGVNRIYEVMPDGYAGSDRAEGRSRSIVGFYDSRHLFSSREVNILPISKELKGARMQVSGVRGKSSVEVSYRPSYYPCFFPLGFEVMVGFDPCDEDSDEELCTNPVPVRDFWDIIRIGGPNPSDREQASSRLAFKAPFFQVRIKVTGYLTVNMFQAIASPGHEDYGVTCDSAERARKFKELVTCCEDSLFTYKIVTPNGPADTADN